jgi:hypothetical protein
MIGKIFAVYKLISDVTLARKRTLGLYSQKTGVQTSKRHYVG